MNDQMDQASRFLRNRAHSRVPGTSNTATDRSVIITGNVAGNLILGSEAPTRQPLTPISVFLHILAWTVILSSAAGTIALLVSL